MVIQLLPPSVGLIVALSLHCLIGTRLGAADEKRAPKEQQFPEVVQVFPDGHLGVCGAREGRVTAMDNDSITVEFPKPSTEWCFDTDEKNRPVRKRTFVYPALPPQKLKVEGPLAQGDLPDRNESVAYRMSDVRVGDQVIVGRWHTRDDVWVCYEIRITRRPGGKIPEAPRDQNAKDLGYKWHEYCQAHQDFEEKGIPIPAKFLPEYKDKIAPMPREVKHPRIPDAEP